MGTGLDGTVVKHNGYRLDGEDSFLPANVFCWERILINDSKPSGLRMVIAVEKERDTGLFPHTVIEEDTARSET